MALLLAGFGGLLAGGAHVLSGPDHLAAVMPLAVRERWRAASTGAWWGVGHAAGVVLLGCVGRLLSQAVDIERLSNGSEALVGLLLIALGAKTLLDTRAHTDRPPHSHGSALGFGFVHGTAGAGHVFGVLPSLAMPFYAAMAYLVAYLAAAIGAMTLFALSVGYLVREPSWIPRALRVTGTTAILVGTAWMISSVG